MNPGIGLPVPRGFPMISFLLIKPMAGGVVGFYETPVYAPDGRWSFKKYLYFRFVENAIRLQLHTFVVIANYAVSSWSYGYINPIGILVLVKPNEARFSTSTMLV
jgi:hypothetical protein